jgi:hypothetical protein
MSLAMLNQMSGVVPPKEEHLQRTGKSSILADQRHKSVPKPYVIIGYMLNPSLGSHR